METISLQLGAPAPDFELQDLQDQTHRLSDYADQIVIIDFWSAECPWSESYDAWLNERAAGWAAEGVRLLAVASNRNESRELIAQTVAERGLSFPVLLDIDCRVADLYGAETTPHVFIVDRKGRLAYRGAIDDRSFRQRVAQVNYLEQTLQALRQGQRPDPAETASYGCTVVRFVAGQ